MRAGFSYYRALLQDAADNREIVARCKLPMPVLAVGGEIVPDCGHWIPEEQPEHLARLLRGFFTPESA